MLEDTDCARSLLTVYMYIKWMVLTREYRFLFVDVDRPESFVDIYVDWRFTKVVKKDLFGFNLYIWERYLRMTDNVEWYLETEIGRSNILQER